MNKNNFAGEIDEFVRSVDVQLLLVRVKRTCRRSVQVFLERHGCRRRMGMGMGMVRRDFGGRKGSRRRPDSRVNRHGRIGWVPPGVPEGHPNSVLTSG